ncbi:SRPBCC family protein [Yoonia sediminilitoris]|uniref:Polyketide cyclase/dehydrase/lipid transport protein n=1 Tax=Yoonia sediminilitoris TaxID=1286148 RepID=A0A2T6K7I9_9RHOB|nr:SRPBCC family protein [Yoonia sediminilitoris]PUB10666.1 hypothetical protein C8N45_11710 [Yoonia sediminilitoris]RCW90418.1 hypothetical protein DFP92_11710 [Yoonia sediminilitoris]
MKFSTREDVEAPIDYVYQQVSDFAGFERRALRHGVNISAHQGGQIDVGSSWDIAFPFRGRERRMQAKIATIDPPSGYRVDTESDGMTVVTTVDLVALSRGRTRLLVAMDLRARSLTARLLLQSMKLAKTKLTKRFKVRVLEFAEDIEDDFRRDI